MFDAKSRYAALETRSHASPEGIAVAYTSRRLIALERRRHAPFDVEVRAAERPDLLAARILADPELYWRLCDANAVVEPDELTAVPGRRVRSPVPG